MDWVEYYWVFVFLAVVGVLVLCGYSKGKCGLCHRKRRLRDLEDSIFLGSICKYGCEFQIFNYTKGYQKEE